MSVTSESYKATYAGAGTTGPYAITFPVTLDAGGNAVDVAVKLVDSLGVETDITSTSTFSGLNVYTANSYSAAYQVVLIHYPSITQPFTFPFRTKFPSLDFEHALDRLCFTIQRLALQSDQSLKAPVSDPQIGRIPTKALRALQMLAFDANGDPIASPGIASAPVSAAMAVVTACATLALARAAFGISAAMDPVVTAATLDAARVLLENPPIAPVGTPYSVVAANAPRLFLVTTGASNFQLSLPTAASMVGKGPITAIKIDSGAGAVLMMPYGAEVIDKAGNAGCYLGAQFQSITLQALAAGVWAVIGGTYEPAHGVDANGSHVELGKLHHLPLGNTTARNTALGAYPGDSTWSAAQQVTGSFGVPAGARGVRLKVAIQSTSVAAGAYAMSVALSDNIANSPANYLTAHPCVRLTGVATAAAQAVGIAAEVDVPLDSSGRFYVYGMGSANLNAGGSFAAVVVGYYMGD
jgi:hypothetical protein